MGRPNKKRGFTLIEIIVVMVIIGILVNIALPNLFSNIPRAKGAVALASADAYKTVLETCFGQNSGTSPGDSPCTLSELNLASEIQGISLIFSGSGTTGGDDLSYTLAGSMGSIPVFTLTRSVNGVFSCSPGGGVYATVC